MRRTYYNSSLTQEQSLVLLALAFVTVLVSLIVFAFYNASFEPTSFSVQRKEWSTTTELYHMLDVLKTRTYDDCRTNTQTGNRECTTVTETYWDEEKRVDDRQSYSGKNDAPVRYHHFDKYRSDQEISYYFSANVYLFVEDELSVTYKPNQRIYENMPIGSFCTGEIGWFNHIRNVNCTGR